jgi:hypothetical protein
MEIELQDTSMYITLTSVLGGFAFAAVIEFFVSDKKGRLVNIASILFSVSAMMFLYALISYVLVYSAFLVEGTAIETLNRIGATALLVTFAAIFVLLGGIGVAGWVHSRPVGIATSVAAGLFVCFTSITFVQVLMAVPPLP